MGFPKIVAYVIVGIAASSTALARDYVVDLNATLAPNTCSDGWIQFGWDGKSKMYFCQKTVNRTPSSAVVDVNAYVPKSKPRCEQEFGEGWEQFAYDKKANLRYCMLKGDPEESEQYVSKMDIIGRGECDDLDGRGWDKIAYNGKSELTLCARFR